jgi:hypothetical protein
MQFKMHRSGASLLRHYLNPAPLIASLLVEMGDFTIFAYTIRLCAPLAAVCEDLCR